jgi:hypothetical protein
LAAKKIVKKRRLARFSWIHTQKHIHPLQCDLLELQLRLLNSVLRSLAGMFKRDTSQP